MERAATTAASLDAEHDSVRIWRDGKMKEMCSHYNREKRDEMGK
ncbi:hypothetical protein Tco_0030615, partial [Tanacetum coccineum]